MKNERTSQLIDPKTWFEVFLSLTKSQMSSPKNQEWRCLRKRHLRNDMYYRLFHSNMNLLLSPKLVWSILIRLNCVTMCLTYMSSVYLICMLYECIYLRQVIQYSRQNNCTMIYKTYLIKGNWFVFTYKTRPCLFNF